MKIVERNNKDWSVAVEFESWQIGTLTYGEKFSKLSMLERHNQTDEVFILLEGCATLYVADKEINITEYKMEKNKLYRVEKGEWHHIVVSDDAYIMVVENSDTSEENSEYLTLA